MKVTFIKSDRCFIFHDLDSTTNEAKAIFMELSQQLMKHDMLAPYEADIKQGERSTVFRNHPEEGRRAVHLGQTVDLTFETDRGAMAFKLTFLMGDQYIPWQSRG